MQKKNILTLLGISCLFISGVFIINIINKYDRLVDDYDSLSDKNKDLNVKNQDTVSSYNKLVEKYNTLNKDYINLESKYSASVEPKTKYITNESCVLYNEMNELYEINPPGGLYMKGTDFYCVWVKEKHQSHVQELDYHENAHYLVNQDYQHFCVEAERDQHKRSCEALQ